MNSRMCIPKHAHTCSNLFLRSYRCLTWSKLQRIIRNTSTHTDTHTLAHARTNARTHTHAPSHAHIHTQPWTYAHVSISDRLLHLCIMFLHICTPLQESICDHLFAHIDICLNFQDLQGHFHIPTHVQWNWCNISVRLSAFLPNIHAHKHPQRYTHITTYLHILRDICLLQYSKIFMTYTHSFNSFEACFPIWVYAFLSNVCTHMHTQTCTQMSQVHYIRSTTAVPLRITKKKPQYQHPPAIARMVEMSLVHWI